MLDKEKLEQDLNRWTHEVEATGETLARAAVRFISEGRFGSAFSNLSIVLMKYSHEMNPLALTVLARQKDASQAVAFINQLQGPAVIKEIAIVALHGFRIEKRLV